MVSSEDLWIYVYEKGEARYTNLIKDFVNTGKCSKTVLLDRKLQLEAAGKIAKKISVVTNRPVYYVPRKFHKEVEKLIVKRDIYDLTDSFDTKWLEILRRLLVNMRKEGTDPKEFFDRYCLAFVGGLPYNFHKSIEGMKYALRHERDLRERARKEGLTIVEYARKRAKHIAKQPKGMRRMLAGMGLTEEQIEARMHVQEIIRKQGIASVWAEIHKEEIRKKEEETRARVEYKREKYATSG